MSDQVPMSPAELAQAIEDAVKACEAVGSSIDDHELLALAYLVRDHAPEITQALRRLAPVEFPLRWNLRPLEVAVLGELLTRQVVTDADLSRMRGGATIPARRIIYNLRQKLLVDSIVIETAHARGYYFTDETKAAVRRLCQGGS